MKTYFSEKVQKYDGSQLSPLYAYLEFNILGDSIISWIGECDIPFANMVDGEDVLAKSEIRGAKMVHFIIEKFSVDLFSGVCLQRLMASLAIDLLVELSGLNELTRRLRREGDDIFLNEQKLSISIATKSPTSTLVHFAVNVVNEGTPVKTLCLNDLEVDSVIFAKQLMTRVAAEVDSITEATQKVRSVH